MNLADAPTKSGGNGSKFDFKQCRIGPAIGLQKLGCSLYTVPPGKRAFPYHAHSLIEEMCELLPVPRTLGLGVKMGLEVADGTTQFQPGVQARGGAVGAGAWGIGCASGARSGPASEHAAQLG